MPSAVVYVAAILSTVAAAIAFKEFVYEPHIAPKIEQWAEQFLAHRRAQRRQRQGNEIPVQGSVPASSNGDRSKRSLGGKVEVDETAFELERLATKEVNEWRTGVGRSQVNVRHRNVSNGGHDFGESSTNAPIITHVIFDPSYPLTPTGSVGGQIRPSPTSPRLNRSSKSTLRSPALSSTRLPIHDSTAGGPQSNQRNSSTVSRDSISIPLSDLGREVLSASSRPDSPFSAFSVPRSPSALVDHQPLISHVELLSASDDDFDIFSVHSSAISNASVDESVLNDDFDMQSSICEGGSVSSLASDAHSHP